MDMKKEQHLEIANKIARLLHTEIPRPDLEDCLKILKVTSVAFQEELNVINAIHGMEEKE